MEDKRTYGALETGQDELLDLEKYANSSDIPGARIESTLDTVFAASLGLATGSPAESNVWGFKKDPWQFYSEAGELLFSLEDIRFTIVRAADHRKEYRCLMVLRLDWTTFCGDELIPKNEVPLFVHVTNGAGEAVLTWDLGRLRVGSGWVRRPLSFIQDFDPRLYEDIHSAHLHLFLLNCRLYEC